MTDNVRTYFSGTTRSLNGRQTISFAVKGDLESFKGIGGRFLYLRITGATGTGNWNHPDPIYLDDLFDCILDTLGNGNDYFTADVLEKGIRKGGRNKNTNLSRYVAAILDAIGLITCINGPRTSGHRFRFPEIAVAGETDDEPPA